MQYLTYEEYTEIGGTLDLTAFNRNIVRACGIIKNKTQGRIDNMTELPDEVKHCLRDLVEFFETNSTAGAVVTSRSQSAGGVSESESYETKNANDVDAFVDNMICDYLQSVEDKNGVSLLYRGCGF